MESKAIQPTSTDSIIDFLKELKYSYSEMDKIFLEGSCFRLYSILKTIFEDARPLYSHLDGHWITKIGEKYYDINGEISKEYIETKEYRVITDNKILSSAYVPTYNGQCVGYGKYNKTV